MSQNSHQLIIIGSGPAGLTAAVYAARAQLHPLLFEGPEPGGQLMGTTYVDNWPGTAHIRGSELMKQMREQAVSFGTQLVRQTIERVDFSKTPFTLWTKKEQFHTRSLIIATGASPKQLGCPGETTYWGKGVSTCAICDGALYQDKQVIIVGGGDTAMESASFMTHFTNKITIVHIRDSLTASAAMQARVVANPTIKIEYETTVSEIIGNGEHVTHAVLKNLKTNETKKIPTDAIFIAVGLRPNSAFLQGHITLDAGGFITCTNGTQTSVPGVFAAGDVTDPAYRQAITAAGSGCKAALEAERFLKNS